ncbi:hypothetical protein [Fibrobacter sp. UWH4]|uniref:hypothetical protein n=1 Tax=Fibrobacter sp. UWH4 TaxID=1896210 RepID=UPI000911FFED|nr:hypothetical protein [Fibrobacter sp. UWH4]SHL69614.1 hypothetical protein SAMN05720762_11113 [Fibrobacter sp. UWH4]
MIKSLKQLLKDVENASLKNFIKKQKRIIEDELGYSRRERVDEDFLFTVLSEGFINEEYRYYIQQTSEDLLDANARFYLKTVKNELEPEFTKKITDVESVVAEIKDFQWSSPSVLNNDVFTYLNKYKLSNQIDWFINAIKNYYEEYGKNDFVDQYIGSIEKLNDRDEIVNRLLNELSKKLNSDISKDSKMNFLLSFFSNESGALLCEMIKNRPVDDDYTKFLDVFFGKREPVLGYVLDYAETNASFKKKLLEINVEVKKVSDYVDSIQKKLVNNAMFLLSKENLDYIIARQTDIQPHFYYDYIRKNPRLKNKINGSEKACDFVDEFLVGDSECKFAPEGIVDFLFTTTIDDVEIERFVDKIEDEYVDLVYLPKFFRENTNYIVTLDSTIIHLLLSHNKIKVDFNNVLFVSASNIVDDIILLAKKQVSKDRGSIQLYFIDDFAKLNLGRFYSFLFKEKKVDNELFEEESNFLITNNVDIVDLATSVIEKNETIPDEKMHVFVRLIFGRHCPKKETNNAFCAIIKKEFDYFINNFGNIEHEYLGKKCWPLNLSILLKNENNILEDYHLSHIMGKISIEYFNEVVKELCDQIGIFDTSKIVDKLLDENCLNRWMTNFGKDKIVALVNSMKNFITEDFEIVLKNRINSL